MTTKTNIQVFLDLDGVCADFDTGILIGNKSMQQKHKVFNDLVASDFPEFTGLAHDEKKKLLAGHQLDPKRKAFKRLFNELSDLKYAIARSEGFFLNLPLMPDAHLLFTEVARITGNLPHILTAPIDGDIMRCAREKEQWSFNNFSGLFDRFVCTKDKHLHATPTSLLIDDRTKYTKKFAEAGGLTILYKSANQATEELKKIIENVQ